MTYYCGHRHDHYQLDSVVPVSGLIVNINVGSILRRYWNTVFCAGQHNAVSNEHSKTKLRIPKESTAARFLEIRPARMLLVYVPITIQKRPSAPSIVSSDTSAYSRSAGSQRRNLQACDVTKTSILSGRQQLRGGMLRRKKKKRGKKKKAPSLKADDAGRMDGASTALGVVKHADATRLTSPTDW